MVHLQTLGELTEEQLYKHHQQLELSLRQLWMITCVVQIPRQSRQI
jgi:hypothetical protein